MSYPLHLKASTGFLEKDRTTLTPLTISIKNMFSKGLKYSQSIPNIKGRAEKTTLGSEVEFEIVDMSQLPESLTRIADFQDRDDLKPNAYDLQEKNFTNKTVDYSNNFNKIPNKPKSPIRMKSFRLLSRLFTGDISLFKSSGSSGSLNFKSKKQKLTVLVQDVVKADSGLDPDTNDNNELFVYNILVKRNSDSYNIKLSFEDFAMLYSKVYLCYPNKRLPPFPDKKSQDFTTLLDFLLKNIAKINQLLQFIVSDKDLRNSPFLIDFLKLDNNEISDKNLKSYQNDKLENTQISNNPTDKTKDLRAIKSLYQLNENVMTPSKQMRSSNNLRKPIRKTRADDNIDSEDKNSSDEKLLKRTRNNGTKAMRKRFGFRRELQVVDKLSLPNLRTAPSRNYDSDYNNYQSNKLKKHYPTGLSSPTRFRENSF
ncbi:hypothetical protein BB561_000783 [Smittium simulii]|uniref:PX domain-containing protein n=1 Tax=Smittium simulii TaxID=133385 RepID=A0A2T9YXQ1_9FUNG|nr:hypothetical protein BB561_000783 [Smittium simulii]